MKKLLKETRNVHSTLRFDLKMRLTTLFLLTALFAMNANNTYSQKNKATIAFENITIERFIDEIEKSTDFRFVYKVKEVDLKRKISISAKDEQIHNILQRVFDKGKTAFSVLENQIYLTKAKKSIKGPAVKNLATVQFSISGIIIDKDGNPLPGASIVEKGTTNGTQSDFDGNFLLEVTDKNAILVISYIGFATQEIAVIQQQKDITVVMEEDAAGLDEVVVVGYGSQRKSDLTGAVVQVTEDDFVKGANTSALQLLNGRASGVQINQSSNAPGGKIDIKIRGASSINGSNEVLVVIDGLPGGSASALSPDDIESIQILKDASASAIYGSRAANGVVLITTKSGKKGKPQFNYSSYVGAQSVSKRINMQNARQYFNTLNDVNIDGGGDIIYPSDQIAAVGNGYDWQDIIFRNSLITNHQLSGQGGGDSSSYYVGLNYLNNQGVVLNSAEERYNARLNYELKPTDKITFGFHMNYNRSQLNQVPLGRGNNLGGAGVIASALMFDPSVGPELNELGYYDINPLVQLENPMALLQGIDQKNTRNTFYATAKIDYEILKGLKASIRVGTQLKNQRNDKFEGELTQVGRASNGLANVRSDEDTYWLAEYLLSYKLDKTDHQLNILGGITYENFDTRFLSTRANDFISNVTGTNLLQSSNPDNFLISSNRVANQLRSVLGRLTYSYKDKYLLTASIRADGTSKFSDKNKTAIFPSASLGWKITSEPFMENQKLFDNLKLRIGYGEIGNQGINNFETISTFRAGSNAVLGGSVQNGAVPARIPNPDLVWETTKEVNVGLDYALFENRLSGSIEYFDRNTYDQLFEKPVPLTTGFGLVRVNFGQVKNSGIEFNINTKNLVGDFKWNTDLVFSFLKNEVVELPDFAKQVIYGNYGFAGSYLVAQEGDPMASFFGYRINGIFQENDDIANSAQPEAIPGHPIFQDTNGDGAITPEDRVILGDPFPDLTFGINNRFSYKDLTLDVYVTGVNGVQTYNDLITQSLYPINAERNRIADHYIDRWTPQNPDARFPSGVNYTSYSDGERKVNTYSVQDASFIRLKNITLGYDIPLKTTKVFKSLNVYLAADNLFTITDPDFIGFDPDSNADNDKQAADIDFGQVNANEVAKTNLADYPVPRILRFGIKLGL